MKRGKVIIVGAGIAGLSAAISLSKADISVKLVSLSPARRSASACAQGGINIAMDVEGDSYLQHAYETIIGGDFLADQPPVVELCQAAPSILQLLENYGCLFNRRENGDIDFRRFGGFLTSRAAYCGSSTGQQILYVLDEQVRKQETQKLIQRYENHEFLRLIMDDNGYARGIVLHNLYDLNLHYLKADAVIIATGGLGFIFMSTTNSTLSTGSANGRLFKQGMKYVNPEFIQFHPTAMLGVDKMRLISEACRSEGGRLWVYGNSLKKIKFPDGSIQKCGQQGQPWYFLEEMYPTYKNLVPRDIASREIVNICNLGLGIDGKRQIYLDISHLDEDKKEKLKNVLDIYQKFSGEDPRITPMKIFPAPHYSMGGAWVDWPTKPTKGRFRQMTNIKGCFSIGEADSLFHGANRLGGNSLLGCIFSGQLVGKEVTAYINSLNQHYFEIPERPFKAQLAKEQQLQQNLLSKNGRENIYDLHLELAHWLLKHVGVIRSNIDLQKTLEKIAEIEDRYNHISLDEKTFSLNQSYIFANQFSAILEISKIITTGAFLRNESRGAHYKEDFPHRDDKNWLKKSVATYKPNAPLFSYEKVDTSFCPPQQRDYLHLPTAPKLKPTEKL